MAAPILVDSELAQRKIRVAAKDVVYVKAILEGYSGLASLFAVRGGELTLATPHSRIAELDRLLNDLADELDLVLDVGHDPTLRVENP